VKYLLDTNIYLEAFRSEQKKTQFRKAFFPLLPLTFFSAVVAYEPRVNAWDGRTRDALRDFISPLERAGRIVTPTFADWVEASTIVTAIENKNRNWRSKLPALLNDILIALCARQIGATLITHNRDDFHLIRSHKEFQLRVVEAS